jgi:hypothetical protein
MSAERFLTGRIGHIVMSRSASLIAKKPEERRLLELFLSEAKAENMDQNPVPSLPRE